MCDCFRTYVFKEIMCSCFWELCPLKKCFEVKQLKIKIMFLHFWLNYCDENRVERILIAVKNINHLFHLASEITEADRLYLFLLSCDSCDSSLGSLEDVLPSTNILQSRKPLLRRCLFFFIFCHLFFFDYDLGAY